MYNYKRVISVAAAAALCMTPLSVSAQEPQTDAAIVLEQASESAVSPIFEKEGIEIPEGAGFSLNE